MKILFLTSQPYVGFIMEQMSRYREHSSIIRGPGYKWDWDDYDIGISFMFTDKVPANHLHKTRINFHPGPLPEYKGRNLCYHALKNGETKFGATIHYMTENFDEGPIIEVSHFQIQPHWCADDLSSATIEEAKSLFVEYLPRILAGEVFYSAENIGGTYYPKQEIDEFVYLPENIEDEIRAITFGKYVPKININGKIFGIFELV